MVSTNNTVVSHHRGFFWMFLCFNWKLEFFIGRVVFCGPGNALLNQMPWNYVSLRYYIRQITEAVHVCIDRKLHKRSLCVNSWWRTSCIANQLCPVSFNSSCHLIFYMPVNNKPWLSFTLIGIWMRISEHKHAVLWEMFNTVAYLTRKYTMHNIAQLTQPEIGHFRAAFKSTTMWAKI